MVIDLSIFIFSKSVHVGMEKNNQKGKEKVEDQPNIYHFDVASGGEAAGRADEHGGEDKHSGNIDWYNGLKKELFKIVWGVPHKVKNDGWNKHGENNT